MTIKIRNSLWTRVAFLVPLPLLLTLWLVTRTTEARWWFWYWSGFAVVNIAAWSWFGVDLTPTEAVVNSLRRRRIPLWAVQSIVQEPFMGGRRVVLWTVHGERVPLRAPMIDFTGLGSPRFEQQFHRIGRWWWDHRAAPPWQPGAPVRPPW